MELKTDCTLRLLDGEFFPAERKHTGITNGQSVPETSNSCLGIHVVCAGYTIRDKKRAVFRQGSPFQISNGLPEPTITRLSPIQPIRDHESCSCVTNRTFLSENCRPRAPPPTGVVFETALPKNGKTVHGTCILGQFKRPEWRWTQQ